MRAARLLDDSSHLKLVDVEVPALRPGSVLVRIEAVLITPYHVSLIDGPIGFGFDSPPRPFTPGSEAAGTVEAVAEDVGDISPGTRVFCDSFIERRVGTERDSAFIGCFAMTPGGQRLLANWPDGALATHMLLPAENATSIERALNRTSMDTLTRLGWFGTAYSAFERTNFRAGRTVSVLGANGLLGVCAVLLALAMGASRVVAVGRSDAKLARLGALDSRVETATEPPTGIDLAIGAASGNDPSFIERSLPGLREGGAMVILATPGKPPSISSLVGRNLSIHGSMWFPRKTISTLVDMIASGVLNVDCISSHGYALDDIDAALAHAAAGAAPFEQVVVRP
jgi:alcohol dehydrogenase